VAEGQIIELKEQPIEVKPRTDRSESNLCSPPSILSPCSVNKVFFEEPVDLELPENSN
jgi:hypothetical protein